MILNNQEIIKHKLRNWLQSIMLGGTLALILGVLSWVRWGSTIAIVAIIFSAFLYLFNSRITPTLVLRMYQARKLRMNEAPRLSKTAGGVLVADPSPDQRSGTPIVRHAGTQT